VRSTSAAEARTVAFVRAAWFGGVEVAAVEEEVVYGLPLIVTIFGWGVGARGKVVAV